MAAQKKGIGGSVKKKGIWIMAAVLVLLSGVYFLLKSQNEKQQQEAQREAEAAKIPVTKDMDLQKISYTDGTDTMTFCKEENWIWEAEPEITLDQDVMTVMEETFSNLTADRELTGGDTLADYGLEDPVYTLKLTDTQGKQKSIYVGNPVEQGRYVTVDDKSRIFTVDGQITGQLYFSLDQVARQETFSIPAGSSNLQQVSVTGQGEEKVYVNEEEAEENSGEEHSVRPIDTVIEGLGAITYESCEDYNAEPEELSAYGLDEASRITVTVTYKEEDETKTKTFYVGSGSPEGTKRYLQMEGSNQVHTVSAEAAENVIAPEGGQ